MEALLRVLRDGGLVVYPTETVYGIGTALSAGQAGVERVRAAKGSPPGRPFLVVAADAAMAFSLWSRIPDAAHALADEAWPGPLTLIGPAREGLPPGLLGERDGEPTISVRVPGDAWLRRVLTSLGEPLISTSANRAGEPPPGAFEDVDLDALRPDHAVDRGRCAGGTPSTLIDLLTDPPTLLRRGALNVLSIPLLGSEGASR